MLEKPAGKRRDQLEAWFSGPEGPQALFAGRVLPFDEKAGLAWAKLMADGKARGRPRSALDTIVAAVAEVNDCVVVTDNEKDFEGVKFFNPVRTFVRSFGHDLYLRRYLHRPTPTQSYPAACW